MVTTGQTYSDLDLMVIGVISAEDAYPGSGGTFDYLTPQWELGNLTFQGGLALLFDTNDIVLFGFEAGFTHLVVQRTGDAPQSFDLGGTYQPWSFEQRMLLRIVRRGNNYYFQGRPERGSIGCLGELLRPFSGVLRRFGVTWPPPPMDPFSDLGSLPAAPTATVSATDWNTFAILPISQTPRGLAYLVKTYPNTIPVVDFSGRSLQILAAGTPGRPPRLTVSDVTSTAAGSTASNYLDLLQTGTYTYHEPRDGPLKIDGDGWHRLIVTTHRVEADGRLTEIGPFNHTDTVDDAPKLATAAPAGDFAVAGSIRLERDTMGPGSGGAHTGMELWAYRHRININDVQLTHEAISRQALPMDGKYAAAFIIVAGSVPQRREKVAELPDSVVDNVDRLRRAWEDYFPKATRNSRFFDTRLTRS
jgi:hypothetical protein